LIYPSLIVNPKLETGTLNLKLTSPPTPLQRWRGELVYPLIVNSETQTRNSKLETHLTPNPSPKVKRRVDLPFFNYKSETRDWNSKLETHLTPDPSPKVERGVYLPFLNCKSKTRDWNSKLETRNYKLIYDGMHFVAVCNIKGKIDKTFYRISVHSLLHFNYL
jgi:hypothetical protein